MPWRLTSVADITQDFTPAETIVLRSVQNSTARLATKLTDTVGEFLDAIEATGFVVLRNGSVPDQIRLHVQALACWRWLCSFPQYEKIKTKEREKAAADALVIYKQICNKTFGAILSPSGTNYATGNWNSENKLIMRTHPVPPPGLQFPATANAASDGRPGDPFGNSLVFSAAVGTVPPFPAAPEGQEAINEATNETWFVNSSGAWQQNIGV